MGIVFRIQARIYTVKNASRLEFQKGHHRTKSQDKFMEDERLNLPSASRFSILALCPGSESLRNTLPPEALDSSNDYAEIGTRIHAAAESGNGFNLTPEELEIYNSGLKCEKLIVRQWCEDFEINTFIEGPRESRMWLNDQRTLKPITSAKLDRHYISTDPVGFVLASDWKTLWSRNLTPAIHNYQGRVQAVVAAKEYEVQNVRLCFNKAMFGTSDFADYDAESLWRAEFSITQALWEAEQPGADLRPGGQCTWCPCKPYCRAAVALSIVPAAYAASSMKLSEDLTPKRAKIVVEGLPVEAVREAWGKRTAVANIVKAMTERLTALPPEEKYRLGLKMNLGRSSDSVRDVRGAFNAMVAGGFPEADIWRCLKMSKANVVDLVKRFNNCRDSEADAFYEVQLDDFIERKRGEEVLGEA